jgi:hypothetical protein
MLDFITSKALKLKQLEGHLKEISQCRSSLTWLQAITRAASLDEFLSLSFSSMSIYRSCIPFFVSKKNNKSSCSNKKNIKKKSPDFNWELSFNIFLVQK